MLALRIRRLTDLEATGDGLIFVGDHEISMPAVLEWYGEVEQLEATDGPTVFGWQLVPVVSEP